MGIILQTSRPNLGAIYVQLFMSEESESLLHVGSFTSLGMSQTPDRMDPQHLV